VARVLTSSALGALLANLIDYAGLFPPASLPLAAALANYRRYRSSDRAWMLGRFVLPAAQVPDLDLPFAVLSGSDHSRAASIESKQILSTPRPTYCEVPLDRIDAVQQAGSFLKIRTGGTTPDAIPSIDTLTESILACAARRLAFKATAGLHHPIRSDRALTYEPGAPRATMHGFVNVFLAAAFAFRGERSIAPILAETDPSAFRFDDRAHWRGRSLSAEEISRARTHFAHSFGSCSFDEPIQDLEQLAWL
jgi:hypothetical protein